MTKPFSLRELYPLTLCFAALGFAVIGRGRWRGDVGEFAEVLPTCLAPTGDGVAILGIGFTMVARLFFITISVLAMSNFTVVQIDPTKLHKLLINYFSLDELRTLSLDLNLDFEELPLGGKLAKTQGLLADGDS